MASSAIWWPIRPIWWPWAPIAPALEWDIQCGYVPNFLPMGPHVGLPHSFVSFKMELELQAMNVEASFSRWLRSTLFLIITGWGEERVLNSTLDCLKSWDLPWVMANLQQKKQVPFWPFQLTAESWQNYLFFWKNIKRKSKSKYFSWPIFFLKPTSCF